MPGYSTPELPLTIGRLSRRLPVLSELKPSIAPEATASAEVYRRRNGAVRASRLMPSRPAPLDRGHHPSNDGTRGATLTCHSDPRRLIP